SRYVGANGDPDSAGRNIENWTPEFNVVDDPSSGVQGFLTPHWGNVESFALGVVRDAGGEIVADADGDSITDYALPPAPQGFFAAGFEASTLDLDAKTITLAGGGVTLTDGASSVTFLNGDVIDLFALTIGQRADLRGKVVNDDFIGQAEQVVAYSGTLTDTGKLVAEFYEDGGGTAFPPGTWMAYGQFVSARDEHDTDADAKLFLALGNAVMDAGIATWEAKIEYDYARPIRAIRDLGDLGLLGDPLDENGNVIETDANGDPVYFIEAFAGFDSAADPANGLGTQLIPASEFVTFQRPGDSSPPFAEYTSGHSAFSRAGAEVLRAFTGSDEFGATVIFEPGSSQFEIGVPSEPVTIELATFVESDGFNGSQDLAPDALVALLEAGTADSDAWNALGISAADQAGLSRLFGGIHFQEGDINGRDLGAEVGQQAFELAQRFIDGTATDADRPFNDPIDFDDALA
ncbi:MAG: vanadium-dependent haloperoxidase, partial [Pseudomonadota bacterium]